MPKRIVQFSGFAAILAALSLSLFTFKAQALADESDLDGTLHKVYAAWGKLSTWQADFTQTTLCQGNQVRKRGHIIYSQDGRFALHYTQPQEALAAISGDRAVAYYPSRKAADQLVSGLVEAVPRLLQVGQPPEVVKLAYDVHWTQPPNPNFYSIEFTPRVPLPFAPLVTKFRVEYDKTSALPVGTWLFDKEGNWMRLEFRRGQVNAKVEPSAFAVKLPAGTKVNDAPDLSAVLGELFGFTTPAAKP
jgi:outer membrane lipoprotein-sorting protein